MKTSFKHVNDLWDDAKAASLDPVERLVYRSNLLGSDQRITNTGGGNTSSKLAGRDPLTGAAVDVLWVKGSGGDLRTSTKANFSSLYQGRLTGLRGTYLARADKGLKSAAEDDMVARAGHHGEEEEHDHDDFDSIVVTPSPADSVDAMRVRVADALNLTGVLRVKGHARISDKAAPIVVQAVGNRVDLSFARPDVKQAEHLVVIGLRGFDGEAVRRALAG